MICKGIWETTCELEEKDIVELKEFIAEDLGIDEEKIVSVMTKADYIKKLWEQLKDEGVPERVLYYVDFDKMINDMENNGEIVVYEMSIPDQYDIPRKIEIVAEIEW